MPSKVAHNRPQTFFSQYWPGCPNQPRIDFSYYKYVPRLICLLICDQWGVCGSPSTDFNSLLLTLSLTLMQINECIWWVISTLENGLFFQLELIKIEEKNCASRKKMYFKILFFILLNRKTHFFFIVDLMAYYAELGLQQTLFIFL